MWKKDKHGEEWHWIEGRTVLKNLLKDKKTAKEKKCLVIEGWLVAIVSVLFQAILLEYIKTFKTVWTFKCIKKACFTILIYLVQGYFTYQYTIKNNRVILMHKYIMDRKYKVVKLFNTNSKTIDFYDSMSILSCYSMGKALFKFNNKSLLFAQRIVGFSFLVIILYIPFLIILQNRGAYIFHNISEYDINLYLVFVVFG